MKEGRENTRSILVSFAVGSLVGAGVALLLAPKSGKELRKGIKDIAVDARDKIAVTVDKGRDLYVEGTTAVKNAFETGKAAYLSKMGKHEQAA